MTFDWAGHYEWGWEKSVFPVNPFHPSVIFAGMSESYISGGEQLAVYNFKIYYR